MTERELRAMVKANYPHIKIKIRTVDFTDLARRSAKCLTVIGDKNANELLYINTAARQAGIVPDGNIRIY